MEIQAKINIEFDKKQLCNAISNALFMEFTVNKNNKKVSEMTVYDLASYLPEIIAKEIINDVRDIVIAKKGD